MKKLFGSLAAAALVALALTAPANASFCENKANGCMQNRGTKDVCFGPAYQACKQSGNKTYIGPYSGKAFVNNRN